MLTKEQTAEIRHETDDDLLTSFSPVPKIIGDLISPAPAGLSTIHDNERRSAGYSGGPSKS